MKNKDIIVLGAGFTGLSSALALVRKGYQVKVIEMGSKPGGIGAEINKNGHKFEMGPHLFHAPDPQIMNDIKNLIKEELVPVTRTIKIKFMGDYYNYPLSIVEVLLKLPKLVVLSALISFLYHYTKSFFYNVKSPNSETVLIQNYGKVLYRIFFESYIEHVWGITPKEFSPKFAQQRIPNFNILQIFEKLHNRIKFSFKIFNKIDVENFTEKVEGELFTTKNGFSGIADKMEDEIINKGGEIIYNSKVNKIILDNDGQVEAISYLHKGDQIKLSAKGVINSIPITNLIDIISPPIEKSNIIKSVENLKFRSLVFVGLVINKTDVIPSSFLYFRDLSFNRLTDLGSVGLEIKIKGTSVLVAELSCSTDDDIWSDDKKVIKLVINDLEAEGIINKRDIIENHVYRLEHAYPIYSLGYEESLDCIMNYVDKINNLITIGRQGKFQYINSHLAIRAGYDAADKIINYLD